MVSTLGQIVGATFAAEAGGAIGIAIDGGSKERLHNLVLGAAGIMLAVTCLDMLPESYPALGMAHCIFATLSGMFSIVLLSRITPIVCPACCVEAVTESGTPLMRTVWLISAALAIHCTLDGIGFVGASRLTAHPDVGLCIGFAFHKLPEGLALTLLLLSAGLNRPVALLWTVVLESFTLAGAGWALTFGSGFGPTQVSAMVAFVAGGFLLLLVSTIVQGVSERRGKERLSGVFVVFITLTFMSTLILTTR